MIIVLYISSVGEYAYLKIIYVVKYEANAVQFMYPCIFNICIKCCSHLAKTNCILKQQC